MQRSAMDSLLDGKLMQIMHILSSYVARLGRGNARLAIGDSIGARRSQCDATN